MRRQVAQIPVLGVVVLSSIAALASCRSDGREMRPAKPSQSASISTLAPVTDPPAVDDGVNGGFNLPAVTTVAPTTVVMETPQLIAPWVDGAPIDARYTCDGENISPALSWSPPPAGTVEVAITLTDDDAPGFVHWAVAAIDPLSTSLGEGRVPEFAIVARSSSGTQGYFGPCPPAGETHTYRFTVYFLGQETAFADGSPGVDMLGAIRADAFDSATVSATYSRV